MKYPLLICTLLVVLQSAAQQNDSIYVAKEKQIQKLFEKVPKGKFADLVPYQENGKWGYLDRLTLKKIGRSGISQSLFLPTQCANVLSG